jgi:hypothetical protein
LDDEESDEEENDDENDEEIDKDNEEEEEQEPVKKKQSKEDNAKFAAERRQKEIDRKVQEELQKRMEESPEYLLAKQLTDQFGKTPQEIMTEMQEAALLREAEESKVPVDVLRRQRDAENKALKLEQDINKLKFQSWQTQIKSESEKLIEKYTMLNQDDLDASVDYILSVAKNVDMPLEDAVFAVHGKKIVDEMAKAKIQNDLANQSGRSKKTPPSPKNTKPAESKSLTAEEKYIAKQFGMSAEEYNKYRGSILNRLQIVTI